MLLPAAGRGAPYVRRQHAIRRSGLTARQRPPAWTSRRPQISAPQIGIAHPTDQGSRTSEETLMSRIRSLERPPASTAGKTAAVLLLVVVTFQVALAAGAPFGRAAFGGATRGVLPDALRVTSATAAVVYLMLAGVAGTPWTGATARRRTLYAAAALMGVGTVLNAASPSLLERLLWTPVTAALVVALWLAARHHSISTVSSAPATRTSPTAGP